MGWDRLSCWFIPLCLHPRKMYCSSNNGPAMNPSCSLHCGLMPAVIGTDISEGWEQHCAPCHLPWEHLPPQHPTLPVHPLGCKGSHCSQSLQDPGLPAPGSSFPPCGEPMGWWGAACSPTPHLGTAGSQGWQLVRCQVGAHPCAKSFPESLHSDGAGQTIYFPSPPPALQHY